MVGVYMAKCMRRGVSRVHGGCFVSGRFAGGRTRDKSYLRDTLPVLSPVENSPCDAAGVLALKEERLGFAVLESEDLAVATDVEFTL